MTVSDKLPGVEAKKDSEINHLRSQIIYGIANVGVDRAGLTE